jgi:hypothetical protein
MARPDNIEIKHNVGAQKLGGRVQRYEVDMAAQLRLRDELLKGYVQIDKWLKKNSLPRLSLPAICGKAIYVLLDIRIRVLLILSFVMFRLYSIGE